MVSDVYRRHWLRHTRLLLFNTIWFGIIYGGVCFVLLSSVLWNFWAIKWQIIVLCFIYECFRLFLGWTCIVVLCFWDPSWTQMTTDVYGRPAFFPYWSTQNTMLINFTKYLMFVFTINIWNESDPRVQNSADVYRRRRAWKG